MYRLFNGRRIEPLCCYKIKKIPQKKINEKIKHNNTVSFFLYRVNAQDKLYSKEAKISFYSKTAMENIDAVNNKGLCFWNTVTGELEFSVLIKGFQFNSALMQEHFNENYMESDKFPKAVFKGVLVVATSFSLQANGTYNVSAEGMLTIHGVSKKISVPVNITSKNGRFSASTNFRVLVKDYNISIPAVVADKIDKQISISVSAPAFKKL